MLYQYLNHTVGTGNANSVRQILLGTDPDNCLVLQHSVFIERNLNRLLLDGFD
jgi:hypothetical protein